MDMAKMISVDEIAKWYAKRKMDALECGDLQRSYKFSCMAQAGKEIMFEFGDLFSSECKYLCDNEYAKMLFDKVNEVLDEMSDLKADDKNDVFDKDVIRVTGKMMKYRSAIDALEEDGWNFEDRNWR